MFVIILGQSLRKVCANPRRNISNSNEEVLYSTVSFSMKKFHYSL